MTRGELEVVSFRSNGGNTLQPRYEPTNVEGRFRVEKCRTVNKNVRGQSSAGRSCKKMGPHIKSCGKNN